MRALTISLDMALDRASRSEAHHQIIGLDVFEGRHQAAVAGAGQIEEVDCPGDIKVGVGVEAVHELYPLVVQ